jgi:hypothetical protein
LDRAGVIGGHRNAGYALAGAARLGEADRPEPAVRRHSQTRIVGYRIEGAEHLRPELRGVHADQDRGTVTGYCVERLAEPGVQAAQTLRHHLDSLGHPRASGPVEHEDPLTCRDQRDGGHRVGQRGGGESGRAIEAESGREARLRPPRQRRLGDHQDCADHRRACLGIHTRGSYRRGPRFTHMAGTIITI